MTTRRPTFLLALFVLLLPTQLLQAADAANDKEGDTKDISIARSEMISAACERAVGADGLAAVESCAQLWLAWADDELPASPYCQEYGAFVSRMDSCTDAIAASIENYLTDGHFRLAVGKLQVSRACDEIALCGAPTL